MHRLRSTKSSNCLNSTRLPGGGQFKNLQRAKTRLGIIVPLTLAAIFLLLIRYFGSYRQSLLVFMGIPTAIVGGVLTLSVVGMNFSISAGVGFIALMGIAILNSLVLVSHYDELLDKFPGESVKKLVLEGTLDRFRPVVITTLVAGLGFLPMAINSGLGSEVQKPLASVVIGGLIIATMLTALLLPALYTMIFTRRRNLNVIPVTNSIQPTVLEQPNQPVSFVEDEDDDAPKKKKKRRR
jgi:cobalt-zinc-cadmium resistance protein CzcA